LKTKKKETKRAYLTPTKVENLMVPFWENGRLVEENMDSINVVRSRVKDQLFHLRNDHKRVLNPTPYKVT
jgi:nicotinate phosphoribosyltransferase